MKHTLACSFAIALACLLSPPSGAGPELTLLSATYFGTAGDDDVQSACAGPDGTFYRTQENRNWRLKAGVRKL